jgi:antibiotic biosynthesis monooxygenase (ABM) superfamily enzyme
LTLLVVSCIYHYRADLIGHSLLAGLLLVLVNMGVYTLVSIFTPGWIEAFWYFDFFPSCIIGNLPLEDILFYFAFGMAVGPLYEFWQEGRKR